MYRNGIAIDGVGNRAAHILIHHAPHIAISFGGNDHVLEFNEIHHVCEESNDAGAVYCGMDWTCHGNLIRHNHFHDIKGLEGKGWGGYLDDHFSSARIEGNVFRRVTSAAFIGGGRDNAIVNNVFIDCTPAVHVDARGLGWAAYHRETLMKRLAEVPWQEEPWKSRYPELSSLDADPGQMTPAGNVIERNIQWRGKWDEIEAAAVPFLTLRSNLLGIDPAVVGKKKGGTFQLRDESLASKIGFERIPFGKMGLRVDEFRPALPVPSETFMRSLDYSDSINGPDEYDCPPWGSVMPLIFRVNEGPAASVAVDACTSTPSGHARFGARSFFALMIRRKVEVETVGGSGRLIGRELRRLIVSRWNEWLENGWHPRGDDAWLAADGLDRHAVPPGRGPKRE